MNLPLLKLYFDIAFHDGLEKLMSDFLGNNKLIDEGFEYLKEYDYYLKDEMVEDNGYDPVFELTIIDRQEFLKRTLDVERKLLFKGIKKNKQTLTSIFDDLNKILTKVESKKGQKYVNLINEELLRIIGDLKIQYSDLIEHHPIYNKIRRVNSSLSYFHCKELPYVCFEKLYELTYDLDLIDDVVVTEEMFMDVFTSVKPELQIVFIKSNSIIAFYLKEIEVFFENLNTVNIEKSQLFLNKQGKVLKSTDLYAALSRGLEKNTSEKHRIKTKIEELKNMYLT